MSYRDDLMAPTSQAEAWHDLHDDSDSWPPPIKCRRRGCDWRFWSVESAATCDHEGVDQ